MISILNPSISAFTFFLPEILFLSYDGIDFILKLNFLILIGSSTQKVKSSDIIPNSLNLSDLPTTNVYKISVIFNLNKIFPK